MNEHVTLTRLADWQDRLTELVVQRMHEPFVWGRHDCVLFAADAVLAMTGEQLLPFEANWTNARQAFRTLRGYCGLAGAVRSTGLEEVNARLARRGDILLVRAPGRDDSMRGALGVCVGHRIAAPGPRGLVMPSLADGVTAWRV